MGCGSKNAIGMLRNFARIKDHIGQGKLEMETGEKILVVDDNSFLRIAVSKMLSLLGYEVVSADSGENGLSLFLKNKFDIVLSDYEMPGMDGVAFACSIKKSSPRTPVVIMTGAEKEAVFFRESNAVDEVISKPFTLAGIDETIQNLLTIDRPGLPRLLV